MRINVGDTVIDDDDIFGDGVNVATRIENECEPGGVYLADNVYRRVRGKTAFMIDDLGEKSLKNIDHPVRLYAVRSAAFSTAPTHKSFSKGATRVLFELNVAERSLRKADEVIPLGGRAFDILLALLDRPGEIVSKGDLIAKVWPDVTVEEGSLRVHLSALRKALHDSRFGNKYITNVQGRGYCFTAPVTRVAAQPEPSISRKSGAGLARDMSLREPCARRRERFASRDI